MIENQDCLSSKTRISPTECIYKYIMSTEYLHNAQHVFKQFTFYFTFTVPYEDGIILVFILQTILTTYEVLVS